jgi:hypothetical protein
MYSALQKYSDPLDFFKKIYIYILQSGIQIDLIVIFCQQLTETTVQCQSEIKIQKNVLRIIHFNVLP